MSNTDKKACPSSKCKTGSQLLGVRQDDGTVAILPEPIQIDEHFIALANNGDSNATQHFRFTNKCVESGCSQWNGKACGVIENLVTHLDALPVRSELPACAIRTNCRWYQQQGANACKVCIFVITEITEKDTAPFLQEPHHVNV